MMNTQRRASAFTRAGRTSTFIIFPALLVLITLCVTVIYYLNLPQPGMGPDSFEYLDLAQRIATHGQLVDPHRLPGFPLLITLVFALTHQGNLRGVSIANAVLFLCTTIEVYFITFLLFKRGWLAFLIGLLVGTNLVLLALVDEIAPESMAIFFLASIALAAILFMRTRHLRYLWLVAACTAGLFFTRGEWAFLPVPLFIYLALMVVRKGQVWRYLLNVLAAIVVLNALLGGYIYINTTQNSYAGITDISNINCWGKVIQYNMQNEGPARYASIAQITDAYIHSPQARNDPYDLIKQHPEVKANHYEAVGGYARAIILGHPVEFLTKSVKVVFYPWPYFYYQRNADAHAPFGKFLLLLQSIDHDLYRLNIVFPLCPPGWLFLLFWRGTGSLPLVKGTGAVVLLVLYGIVVITVAGYDSYIRLDAPFTPLLTIVVWGSLANGVLQLVPARWRRTVASDRPAPALQTSGTLAWQLAQSAPGLQPGSAPAWQQFPQTGSIPMGQIPLRSVPGLQANRALTLQHPLPSSGDLMRALPITEDLAELRTQEMPQAPASASQTVDR